MTAFCMASVLIYTFLFAIWSRDGWLNFFFKMIFGIMVAWAVACTLIQLGFHQ